MTVHAITILDVINKPFGTSFPKTAVHYNHPHRLGLPDQSACIDLYAHLDQWIAFILEKQVQSRQVRE